MDKKLNILFITSWYPNRTNPFSGNFIKRHAEAVAQISNVTVLHFQSDEKIKTLEVVENTTNNLKEIICYYPKVKNKLALLKGIKNYKRISHYLKNIALDFARFDLIHLHVAYPMGLISLNIKKKYKLPIILTEHSTKFLNHPEDKMGFIEKILAKYILKHVDIICPISDNLNRSLSNSYNLKNLVTVRNVVNELVFKIKKPFKNDKKVLLHISTLNNRQKNIEGIVSVCAQLAKKRDDFILKIIGDGDTSELFTFIKKYNLNNNVFEFLGPKKIEDVANELQKSDALILFSNFENLPCVISEAHMCGIPVISSNVGGINEMIDETNGKLVEAKNENQLFKSIDDFLNDTVKYDTNKIREKALERYGYNNIAENFLKLYRKLINE